MLEAIPFRRLPIVDQKNTQTFAKNIVFLLSLQNCIYSNGKSHELKEAEIRRKPVFFIWKEKGIFSWEIAKWLGRYRLLFNCLGKARTSHPFAKKMFLTKGSGFHGDNCYLTCNSVLIRCVAANVTPKCDGIVDLDIE